MPDIIQLLPDSIANQIAAGEVIQRPASVIKELLDNAVDAGATEITVIIRDAGKTTIHIQDNGSGMSPTDARMSLERHATSKLRSADDLFDIRTMGFRGEALASIAAIAHVEIKTRRMDDRIGTRLLVEASEVKVQEGCQAPEGTSIIVRNLFYNVPARRKFLKSDNVEMRHLLEEFHHLALAFENIHFKLYHNDQEVYNLPAGTLRNRILGIFGKKINEHLVPVDEQTNYVNFAGYIGKPKLAKKTRGEQFLFVNRRFIRSPYLQHAVKSAYEDILPTDQFPFYVLFLEIDPKKIDVNVHPTKQEIKFEDDRVIYNYLRVACRHALGKYSITPSLDFEQEVGMDRAGQEKQAATNGDLTVPHQQRDRILEKENIRKWGALLESMEGFSLEGVEAKGHLLSTIPWMDESASRPHHILQDAVPTQLWHRYIVLNGVSELLIIDQRAAHERVLFENMMKSLEAQSPAIQKLLWPENIQCTKADAEIIRELLPQLKSLGFDIDEFGHDSFIVHGIPALMTDMVSPQEAIEDICDRFKDSQQLEKGKPVEKIATVLSASLSRKRGEVMNADEMRSLVEQLLLTNNPYTSPSGRKTFITFSQEEILRRFQA